MSDRSNVTFDFNNNEIRDFKKNEKLTWDISKTNQSVRNMKQKKEPKKPKGKGKNRKNQTKSKEEKLEKARRKRQEREEAEKLAEEEIEEENSDQDNDIELHSDDAQNHDKGINFAGMDELDVDDGFSSDDDEDQEA